ncbi:MAG TPA: hypothetical protein VIK13_13620 [Candidatus Limnocylindrales bacterium]
MSDEVITRALWGRIGGLTAWSRNDPATMVGPAHRGFRARFEAEVRRAADARGETLTPAELATRADRARRAHMLTLAALSAAARKKPAPVSDTTGSGQEGRRRDRQHPTAA